MFAVLRSVNFLVCIYNSYNVFVWMYCFKIAQGFEYESIFRLTQAVFCIIYNKADTSLFLYYI